MNIGYKLHEGEENFNELQIEMALTCDANGWCMEDGYDEDGRRYLIINPPYVPTLEDIKTQKISSLKSERDRLEVQPIKWNRSIFDYDEKARERIKDAIIALNQLGEEATLSWTCADHEEVIVSAEDLQQVVLAVAQRSNALHIAYRVAKEKVMNAETEDEVNAVDLEVADA